MQECDAEPAQEYKQLSCFGITDQWQWQKLLIIQLDRQGQFVKQIYVGKRGAPSRGTDVETVENA